MPNPKPTLILSHPLHRRPFSVASRGQSRKPMTAAANGPWTSVSSTAYCLSGTMADGFAVRTGAVASNDYPLGTRLMIRGRGWVTVEDRIGYGTQLDIWMSSCADAVAYGRQEVEISRG